MLLFCFGQIWQCLRFLGLILLLQEYVPNIEEMEELVKRPQLPDPEQIDGLPIVRCTEAVALGLKTASLAN